MRYSEALLVEGTSRVVILCYGVVPRELANEKFDLLRRSGLKTYKILEENWPNCVLLSEVSVSEESNISAAISDSLRQMLDGNQCIVALCIYDGAFGGYEDLFAAAIANQIYAFAFENGSHVINLDENFLESTEWASIVKLCFQRFSGEAGNG